MSETERSRLATGAKEPELDGATEDAHPRQSGDDDDDVQSPSEIQPSPRDVQMPEQSPWLKLVYWGVWFGLVPIAAIYVVFVLVPPIEADPAAPASALREIVHGQPIPVAIGLYSLFTLALWFARHQLPLAGHAFMPMPERVPEDMRRAFERARALIEEVHHILSRNAKAVGRALGAAERKQLDGALGALKGSMYATEFRKADFVSTFSKAESVVERRLGRWRKSEWREIIEGLVLAFGVAVALRSCMAEPFKIPSASMLPTLHVGDHIFVNKLTYGPTIPFTSKRLWSGRIPTRGEVAVFACPEKPEQDYIKRIIGLPGDKIEAKNGRPIINGWQVPSCLVGTYTGENLTGQLYIEYLGDQAYFTLDAPGTGMGEQGPFFVKEGEVFAMGDNRNNSHDSRFWFDGAGGGVPFDFLRGPAMFIWLSLPERGIDWSRMSKRVMPSRPNLPGSMKGSEAALEKCLRERPSSTTPPAAKK